MNTSFFCDPQTSGGLLFSVAKDFEIEMDAFLGLENQFFAKVGSLNHRKETEIVFE
jgi:selenophosphate synthase